MYESCVGCACNFKYYLNILKKKLEFVLLHSWVYGDDCKVELWIAKHKLKLPQPNKSCGKHSIWFRPYSRGIYYFLLPHLMFKFANAIPSQLLLLVANFFSTTWLYCRVAVNVTLTSRCWKPFWTYQYSHRNNVTTPAPYYTGLTLQRHCMGNTVAV